MPVWLRKIVLVQHNCSGCRGWSKSSAAMCTCKKEYSKYYLTATQCFWLAHHNDWSRWCVISSPPAICRPRFNFRGGVAKEYINQTWMWKIFSQSHILSTAGDALNAIHKTWTNFKFWAKPLGGGTIPKIRGPWHNSPIGMWVWWLVQLTGQYLNNSG
jgi:hypothetical protein